MKTLTVSLADIEGVAHGSILASTSARVRVSYTGPVVLTSGEIIPQVIKERGVPATGVVEFSVHASDDPLVKVEYQGFAVKVEVTLSNSRSDRDAGRWVATVKPLEAMTSPIALGTLDPAEGLPAQWVSVADFAADLTATATDALTAAQSAQADAADAATRAENAEAAKLEIPDANTAAMIDNPTTDTRAALAAREQAGGIVNDRDHATLDAAVTATPTGGTLRVTKAWTRTTALAVDKACVIEFGKDGQITNTTAGSHGINVTSSDVTLRRPRLFGSGAASAGTKSAINATSPIGQTYTGLRIEEPHINGWDYRGIYLERCDGFTITDLDVSTINYAGVEIVHTRGGTIRGGTIRNVTLVGRPGGVGYGIALTRSRLVSLADGPNTSDITVDGVTVDGCSWEGIDTHGGRRLKIINNTVLNCGVGIALVPAPQGDLANEIYGPLDCLVMGNHIDSGVTDGSRRAGVQIVGAGASGAVIERATATVIGNTVIGHGLASGTIGGHHGAILLQATNSVTLASNRIIAPGTSGVLLYFDNASATLIDNYVEDAWSTGAVSAIVYSRDANNSFTVSGTSVGIGPKVAATINARGLWVGSATGTVVTDNGGNEWSKATTPTAGQILTTLRASFFGATPVGQAAPITSPAANVDALKARVDDIILVLKNLGITR